MILVTLRNTNFDITLYMQYCSCGIFAESTTLFFLHCTHFSNQRLTLINKIKDIDKRIFDKNGSLITQTLLFGDEKLSITDDKSILEATIQFLISSGGFDSPLYWLLDILPHWTVFTLELIFWTDPCHYPVSFELLLKFFIVAFQYIFFCYDYI